MANEISLGLTVTVSNGGYSRQITENLNLSQASQGESAGIIATTTTKAAIPLGSLTTGTQGVLFGKNLDASNNVIVGVDEAGTFIEVATFKPGEAFCVRMYQSRTYQVKAAAGTPNFQYVIFKD